MAIAILSRWSMTYWPYHEWLADSPEELHLFTTAAKLDLPQPERDRALARYASIHCYESLERNARPLLDIADLARTRGLKALVAQAEWDLVWAGALRDWLGIPGQSYASALAYRNKAVMKDTLAAAGVAVTPYRRIETIFDVADHAARYGYPVAIKPRAGAGAMGLTVVANREQLDALAEAGLTPRIEHTPDLMVERFVEGHEYIVDGFVLDGRLVFSWPSSYIGAPSDYHVGGRHLAAVMLEPDHPLRARLQELTARVVRALPSPATFAFHAEYYHTPDDRLVFGEIGSRTGGARIDDLYHPIFGISSLNGAWARFDAGSDPQVPDFEDVERVRDRGLAGWITFSPQPGALMRVAPPPREPWISWRLTAKPGAALLRPLHSGDFFASAVVTGRSFAEVETRITTLAEWFWSNTEIGVGAPALA